MRLHRSDLLLFLLGLGLLGLTIGMGAQGLVLPEVDPPCVSDQAVICAELPRSGAHLTEILSAEHNPEESWSRVLWLDMPYLLLYAALLGLAFSRDAPRDTHRRYVQAMAILFALGALSDLIENATLLTALDHVGRGWPIPEVYATRIRHAALGKFFLLDAGVIGVAAARLVGEGHGGGWLSRIALAAALGLAFVGLFSALFPGLIRYALLAIVVACVHAWVGALVRLVRARRSPAKEGGAP